VDVGSPSVSLEKIGEDGAGEVDTDRRDDDHREVVAVAAMGRRLGPKDPSKLATAAAH
jgi:hypothetical protein